ncbi:MAG TPA: DUF1501 domain-containing protein [Candidatus Cybelea sp.]|nr:DUF1501 domain-containing protein [Candidatus Cybelea sp.]
MHRPVSRRTLLQAAAAGALVNVLPIGRSGWAATAGVAGPKLVVVFLRGAVDGLNVVVPHGERAYYDERPHIAIPRQGGENGVIDLDGHFGLHPALRPMQALWRDGSLAFVHACGSPDTTRSHFDAQDYMESGTPGLKTTPDGWLNRVVAELPGPHGPTDALGLGPTLPRILTGRMPVAMLPLGRGAARPMAIDRPEVAANFDRLYAGDDSMSRAYQEGRTARSKLVVEMADEMKAADNGAPPPDGFSNDTERLARLMSQDHSIRIAFLALGGWDTHVNQGSAQGQLANHLKPLADGLAAFAQAMGPAWHETVVLVISEFGRTMRENGNGGTDHGHGNVMWVMGGPVRGGKVYGPWPGLGSAALYQGRDLAVTTDFRHPIAAVLERHFRLTDTQLAKVFPAMPKPSSDLGVMLKA